MKYFLIVLVASVFLGTEAFAIPTPVAQLTIYRACALSVPFLLIYYLIQHNTKLKIKRNSYASLTVAMYIFWWVWSVVSILWVENIGSWLQAVFLLTLGISSIIALYFWTNNLEVWKVLVRISWGMMSILVLWGYYEIITNHYLFADLAELDKHNTFASAPMTRIPITHFANQNDYATMLFAYLSLTIVLYYLTSNIKKKMLYIIMGFSAVYLIYRTDSRMIILCLILYAIIHFALKFKWDFKRKHYIATVILLAILFVGAIAFVPQVQNILDTFIYTGSSDIVTGDTGRVNLLRNGLVFLGHTLGLGVGAGNIETWMRNYRFLPTNNIVNIHNWWGEILVGYGLLIFILYTVCYMLLVYRLFQIRKNQSKRNRNVTNQLIAFLISYIFASMTSASNMLIEWHWVFFGLIISYIKVCEDKLVMYEINTNEKRKINEFNYSIK